MVTGVLVAIYVLAALVTVGLAFAPAPSDPKSVLLEAPPAPWERVAIRSGAVDERLLGEYGLSLADARSLAVAYPGYARIWVAPARRATGFAVVIQPANQSAREFLALLLQDRAGEPPDQFRVTEVPGATGFVRPDAVRSGYATRVVVWRADNVFVLGVDAAAPQIEMARRLAVAQSALLPTVGARTQSDWAEAGSYAVGSFILLCLWLLWVNMGATLVATGAWARRGLADLAGDRQPSPVAHAAVSVSSRVRVRKRLSRAVFLAKALGVCLFYPVVVKPLWPGSLLYAAAGTASVMLGVWLERRARRRDASPARKAAGYRRVLTGRNLSRGVALLAVSAIIGGLGLLAVVKNQMDSYSGQDDDAGIQMLFGFFCLVLAVPRTVGRAAMRRWMPDR